jgi:protein gp37
MADSAIEWTGKTWNPTTGCDRISPGCDHCYALTLAKRLKGMGQAKYQTDGDPRTSGPGFGVAVHPAELDRPLHWRKPVRVFANSMSDLFHARVPVEFVAQTWVSMSRSPQHTYQILTKRPERMLSWVRRWYSGEIAEPYEVRPVPGYPGYTVSTLGEVFGKRNSANRPLSHDVGEQGHRRVSLYRADSPRGGSRELVHRLVLTTFVRSPRNEEQACHRNGDSSDNRLSNLYWGSQAANWQDRLRHGNGRSWSKLTKSDVDAIKSRAGNGESAYRIAKDYPVSDTQVRNILRGNQWVPQPASEVVRAPARALLDSVWLGTSIELDEYVRRADALRQTSAAVRFLSLEPLLGPLPSLDFTGIDWTIIGGESGPGARPMELSWARDLINRARDAGSAVFVKQLGSVLGKDFDAGGHGGDWDRWPADLRIREYPEVTRA